MRNLSKTLFITLVVAFMAITPCCAVVLDKDYLEAKITEDLNNQYKQNNPDGAIVVKNVPSVQVDLKGTTLEIATVCDFANSYKNKTAKVILSENGITLRTFIVPVEIKAYEMVLVSSKDILKGEKISLSNTKYEKRNISSNSANIIVGEYDFANMVAQRTIKAGEILDKRFLAKETAVFRSSLITAVFQTGGIRLSIDVTALENGAIGEYIKVKSKEYNKIYQGKVISANQVLIQI